MPDRHTGCFLKCGLWSQKGWGYGFPTPCSLLIWDVIKSSTKALFSVEKRKNRFSSLWPRQLLLFLFNELYTEPTTQLDVLSGLLGSPFIGCTPPHCCAVVDSLSRCTRHPRQSPDRRPERPAARTDGHDGQPATGRQSDVLDVSTTFSGEKHRPDCLVAPPLPICQLHPPPRHVSTLRFGRFRFGSSTAAIDRRP